jgi:hypothetical protein
MARGRYEAGVADGSVRGQRVQPVASLQHQTARQARHDNRLSGHHVGEVRGVVAG